VTEQQKEESIEILRRTPMELGYSSNDFGIKHHRGQVSRKNAGWLQKAVILRGGLWSTERERMNRRQKSSAEERRNRVREPIGCKQSVSEADKALRDRGPRRRRELRLWGMELGENGRPTEKRLHRSQSEHIERSMRQAAVASTEQWNGRARVADERDKCSFPRESGEAIKRYVTLVRERNPCRRRSAQNHNRRLRRENEDRVGGRLLLGMVFSRCGVLLSSRGRGYGRGTEGIGRKGSRETQSREQNGSWGRKPIDRDIRGIGYRKPNQKMAIWRNSKKRPRFSRGVGGTLHLEEVEEVGFSIAASTFGSGRVVLGTRELAGGIRNDRS
jgi:hypothetical protein